MINYVIEFMEIRIVWNVESNRIYKAGESDAAWRIVNDELTVIL